MSKVLPAVAAAALLLTSGPCGAQETAGGPDWTAQGRVWWSHVEYLASDELEGRLTGTPAYDKAAAYVAETFARAGLQPAGDRGYFQDIRFVEQTVDAGASQVTLQGAGGPEPVALGEEMLLPGRMPQPGQITAPLVFIGYGLSIPRAGHDDFAGRDLKGKIAVVINGGPAELSGPMKSSARNAATWKAAAAAGALGIITIPTPKGMDIPWARQMVLSSQPGMYLAETALQETTAPRFTATVNPARAERLFARSGRSFADILARAEAGKPLESFPLDLTLSAKVATRRRTVTSANILAVLPGADPVLGKEHVVVSAHLDHLGVGAPIGGDAIYNGAMDDASGVATVIEIAKGMAGAKVRPKRSILFAVFTAEEKGLLGARAFVQKPPQGRVLAADVNMDMFLPLWPFRHVMIQGVDESTLGADARAVAALRGLTVTTDPYPDRNSFVRTDQYSFVRAGIPALSLKFGFDLGSPEQQMEKDWRTNRYHSPADDVNQPFDPAAAAQFNAYVAALALRIADGGVRPAWNPESIFAPQPAK